MPPSPSARRTRKDPRREATRIAIIEAAETLFATNGIDGVSLRQIGSAIGSSNTSVVAYHFGNKESLVEAIFHYRLPAIEARRLALLEEARRSGKTGDTFWLLRALWLPLLEQVNGSGVHSYAGFMSALMHSSMGAVRLAVNSQYPTTIELADCLRASMPEALRPQFDSRVLMTTVMVTGSPARTTLVESIGGSTANAPILPVNPGSSVSLGRGRTASVSGSESMRMGTERTWFIMTCRFRPA